MTKGCTCGTPGCQGLAPARGQKCPECRIAAHPSAAVRSLLRAVSRALTGPPLTVDSALAWRSEQQAGQDDGREATS